MDPKDIQKIIEALQPTIDQSIKEAHLVGIQSGLKQNSGLVDEIFRKMEAKLEPILEPIIQKLVNGKSDKIQKTVDDMGKKLEEVLVINKAQSEEQERVKKQLDKLTQETSDMEKKTEPVVTEYNNKKTVNNYFSSWGSKIKDTWAVVASLMGIGAFFYWLIEKFK